jgi:phosphate transport system protein
VTRVVDPVLEELRELLLRMGSRAEAILDKAIRAIGDRSPGLAREVEADDVEIDRLDVVLDEAVLKALALQAPVAGDLRQVVAIKMIATDLERVGDLSRNIAKSIGRLGEHPETPVPLDLMRLARTSQDMLHRALDAFGRGDAGVARAVLDADEEADRQQDELVLAELREIAANPDMVSQGVDIILVAKNLERVADHATNIAEDVILMTEARNVKHAAKLRG